MNAKWLLLGSLLFLTALSTTATGQNKKKVGPAVSSPDGRFAIISKGQDISVLDGQTKKELIRMRGHTKDVSALAISPSGKILASGGKDARIALWDVATGRQMLIMKTSAVVEALQFSDDSKTLDSHQTDKTISTWDIATGRLLKQVKRK